MKKDAKRAEKTLKLDRETVVRLNEKSLEAVAGGSASNCQPCFEP